MVNGRENFIQQVLGAQLQAGGVNAGMAADEFVVQHCFVDQQADTVFLVVHQTQDTDGAGGDIQVFFHELRFSEGQAGASDLLGKNGCLELFCAGEEQEIKGGFLGVPEKQVLTDVDAQPAVHILACFDGGHGIMIQATV